MAAIATGPMPMRAPPGRGDMPDAPPRQTQYTYEQVKRWLDEAREVRRKMDALVWTPLYERVSSQRMLGRAADEITNAFQQYMDVVLPHLLGDEREVLCKVNKLAAGEDGDEKEQFADFLGKLATALGQGCGLYRGVQGRMGELETAIRASFWSMGILHVGFEPPRGLTQAQGGREGEPAQGVDLNMAYADHNELADAGSPFARAVSARRFLGDATFGNFSRGRWVGEEYALSVAEARARFPQWRDKWAKTHDSAPAGGMGQTQRAGGDGVILFADVTLRDPAVVLTIPVGVNCGVQEIVEERELALGIEGFPYLFLGHDWVEDVPYPKPLLLRALGSAKAQQDLLAATYGAAAKLRNNVLVNASEFPELGKLLRKGDDQGVIEIDGDPREAFANLDVGALRSEYLQVNEEARAATERDLGISDFLLGKKEPGDPTVPETQARQGAIAARRANIVRPTRNFEAAAAAALVAVALEKKELLHGTALKLAQGGELVVIDATRPVIGEILDYQFTTQVTDAVTQADEADALATALAGVGANAQLLAAVGKQVRVDTLTIEYYKRLRIPHAEELVVDLPPPQPQPGMGDPNAPQAAPPAAPADVGGLAAGPEQAPPATGGDDPAGQYEQLVQMLQQIPEGDPREEQIMQALGQLVQQHPELQGQQQAAA